MPCQNSAAAAAIAATATNAAAFSSAPAFFGCSVPAGSAAAGSPALSAPVPAPLAPVKVAVLPLVKKDGLPEKAQEVVNELKYDFAYQYDEKDSIGKRYRRQDAIGTPFCVTIDNETMNDNCLTVRDRDTMQQTRVPISELRAMIDKKVNMSNLLRNL